MGKLIIVRGLPGSGKTTEAMHWGNKLQCMVVEPDRFLMHHGLYKYTAEHYQKGLEYSLDIIRNAGEMNADCVVADVLPTRQDVSHIINIYSERTTTKPEIKVIDMPRISISESRRRNIHNVDELDLLAMDDDWEDWPDAVFSVRGYIWYCSECAKEYVQLAQKANESLHGREKTVMNMMHVIRTWMKICEEVFHQAVITGENPATKIGDSYDKICQTDVIRDTEIGKILGEITAAIQDKIRE